MPFYSEERKHAVLKRLLPPENLTISELAQAEAMSPATLYNWRKRFNLSGRLVSDSKINADQWAAQARFAAVVETSGFSEVELSEYCREKGLYPQQLKQWKQDCIDNVKPVKTPDKKPVKSLKEKRAEKRIKKLEKELNRKDKALAEASALLLLSKKARRLVRDRQRGQLTPQQERQQYLQWFNEAIADGARRYQAADILEISLKTLNRRDGGQGKAQADQRPVAKRTAPANQLSQEEEQKVLDTCNQPEFCQLPPSQIVPILADHGVYIASESSFYRILKKHGQLKHRGRSKQPQKRKKPTTHIATTANQVWSWDITYLPSRVKGQFWYLYLILDIYSRKIVGWEAYEAESGEYGQELLERTMLSEACLQAPPVLHSDNGAPMTSFTFKAKMESSGVISSYSRPRVSNDNPYSESMFRTVKYCPDYPSKGFDTLEDARHWMLKFARYYNCEHRHSGIKFVTPEQRHTGKDKQLLQNRKVVYEMAQARNPERFGGKTRNWEHIGEVALNPEKKLAA